MVLPGAVIDDVTRFFLEKVMTFLDIVTTHILSAFQAIVCVCSVKFSRKNRLLLGCHPLIVSPGEIRPPSRQ